jgi:hypothetical protein
MKSSNTQQESRSKDSTWYLLGEYSLRELLPDLEKGDKLAAGMLSEMVRELAIAMDGVEDIGMTLRSFAREALLHFKQGNLESAERMRIFCQKKMINQETKGGWGYFVIERARDASSSDCIERLYDFYIYEEGR